MTDESLLLRRVILRGILVIIVLLFTIISGSSSVSPWFERLFSSIVILLCIRVRDLLYTLDSLLVICIVPSIIIVDLISVNVFLEKGP